MSSSSAQLEVGVIGAGIAGLSAAIAISRAGHAVELYEKSRFRNETGAAIVIGPNGTRVLSRWGFDFDEAGALDYSQMRRIRADTLESYGDRWLLFHRADLHTGLKKLVEGRQPQPKINLGTAVKDVDVDGGIITLASGEQVKKDLVIIADGAHGELISKVIGRPCPVSKSPMSMYRFLQPFDKVLAHPEAGQFYKNKPSGFTTFYKTEVGRLGLLINTYPCRGGELLYVALVLPTKSGEKELDGCDSPADYQDVISDAKAFHPAVQAICEDATEVKVYTQMWRDPLERSSKGRAVLIGDAGHLMLPTHGQGASMALEDGLALETLFKGITSKSDVEGQVQLFDKLRRPRVSAVQTMSNKMMGPPDRMLAEVKRYYDGPIPRRQAKTFSKEYDDFFFRYDIEEEAKNLLNA
ncbi:hypothetical protein LTS15_006968 [Exophiala xenobiotica]|nr:hypothetical protein LTS15_006968 [Exophiala xenobiotica]